MLQRTKFMARVAYSALHRQLAGSPPWLWSGFVAGCLAQL